jgi:hypothetical protein
MKFFSALEGSYDPSGIGGGGPPTPKFNFNQIQFWNLHDDQRINL